MGFQPKPKNGLETLCTLETTTAQTPLTTHIMLGHHITTAQISRMPHFPSPLSAPNQQHNNYAVFKNPLQVSLLEKQASVALFRDKMLPWFPFAHLPQDATTNADLVNTLAKDKPLFLLAIVTMTTLSLRLRRSRVKEMVNILLQEIIADTHPTIDLVLAVVTLVAWKYETSFSSNGSCRLLALLGPAVHGMCLDISGKVDQQSRDGYSQVHTQDVNGRVSEPGDIQEVLEKARAVLGHYILTSS